MRPLTCCSSYDIRMSWHFMVLEWALLVSRFMWRSIVHCDSSWRSIPVFVEPIKKGLSIDIRASNKVRQKYSKMSKILVFSSFPVALSLSLSGSHTETLTHSLIHYLSPSLFLVSLKSEQRFNWFHARKLGSAAWLLTRFLENQAFINRARPLSLSTLEANFLLQLHVFKGTGGFHINYLPICWNLQSLSSCFTSKEPKVFWCRINPAHHRFLFECLCTSFACQSLSWRRKLIFENMMDSSRLCDSILLSRKKSQVKPIFSFVCFVARRQQMGNLSKWAKLMKELFFSKCHWCANFGFPG